MFKHFLLPTDGSELSNKAVKKAIQLAQLLGARITALHVIEPYHPPYLKGEYKLPEIPILLRRRYEKESADRARRILGEVSKAAEARGVKCSTVSAKSDSPYEAIVRQAAKLDCDFIVMASHGRKGLRGILLGSETQKVLTHSEIPVLVCR